jgi:hypothetical protein
VYRNSNNWLIDRSEWLKAIADWRVDPVP